jgi:hypothetical protein
MSDTQRAGRILPTLDEQLHFMGRQADLLDEQGHDVSARVMRDCAAMLALKARELEQQTDFKYKANLRADKFDSALRAVLDEVHNLTSFEDELYGVREAKRLLGIE